MQKVPKSQCLFILVLCFQIMGNTIQISVVADAYCARISNLYMYDSVR